MMLLVAGVAQYCSEGSELSINQAISFPKRSDHRVTKVVVGFLLLMAATVLAAESSDSGIATLTASQIAEQF
jgi:hypothetical protein